MTFSLVAFALYSAIGCVLAWSAYKSAEEDILAARAKGEDMEPWIDAVHIFYTLCVALLWWVAALLWVWIWFGGKKRA